MRILRASAVAPVSQPPIRDGAVFIYGNRINRIACWRELSGAEKKAAIDLGDCA
jgi:hypothetical protein